MFKVEYILYFYIYENYDIAIAMSSSRADPVLGHCPGWVYLDAIASVGLHMSVGLSVCLPLEEMMEFL